jgi:glycerophosphoryl diester phosphodiesterase
MTAIIGHRGASGYRPEHTRSAYELALAQGVDLVEPDVVATKDGVLVVRHENEISGTTDVADRAEFAHLQTTKSFAGHEVTGWFTEDFSWGELQSLRCTERIPKIRPANAAYDGVDRILSLPEVLEIARAGGVGVVVEVKHAPYFGSIGLDLSPLVARDLRAGGWQDADRGRLIVESFEESALHEVRAEGIDAEFVDLLEDEGTALDLLIAHGADAPSYRDQLTDLAALAQRVDGISVDKSLLLDPAVPAFAVEARERGLELFTWTARPENAFLSNRFRGSGTRAEHGEWRAEWRAIREAGVTGVFADHPDLAREIFGGPCTS